MPDTIALDVEKYEWLVSAIAKKYSGRGVDIADLKQEGFIGLMKAFNKFDPRRGVKFETHATWWIKAEIKAAVANYKGIVRVPRWMQSKIVSDLRKENTECWGEVENRTEKLLKQKDYESKDPRGLENTPRNSDIFKSAYESMLVEKVKYLFENLKMMEKIVLKHRHDIWEDAPKSFKDLGSMLEISPQRAKQIEQEALLKLRGKLEHRQSAHICR